MAVASKFPLPAEHIGDGHRDFERYLRRILDTNYEGKINSWGYRWTFSCWRLGGLSALPAHPREGRRVRS